MATDFKLTASERIILNSSGYVTVESRKEADMFVYFHRKPDSVKPAYPRYQITYGFKNNR